MATETVALNLRLPRELHTRAKAGGTACNLPLNTLIAQAIAEKLERDSVTHDDAGQRFIVRAIDAPLPYLVLDRTYQFGASSFGTPQEAQRVAAQWNEQYPQQPSPRPALVS